MDNNARSRIVHPLTPNPSPARTGEGSVVVEMACGHFIGV